MRSSPMMGTAYKILDQPFDHVSTQRERMLMMPHNVTLIMCKGMEHPDNRARTDRSVPYLFLSHSAAAASASAHKRGRHGNRETSGHQRGFFNTNLRTTIWILDARSKSLSHTPRLLPSLMSSPMIHLRKEWGRATTSGHFLYTTSPRKFFFHFPTLLRIDLLFSIIWLFTLLELAVVIAMHNS